MLKHKPGAENKAVDALSYKVALLHSKSVRVIGFECLSKAYPTCLDFEEIYKMLLDNPSNSTQGLLLKDGFLLKGNSLCIP